MNIERILVWLGILVTTASFWIMVGMVLVKHFK